jgi:hypothetical protein
MYRKDSTHSLFDASKGFWSLSLQRPTTAVAGPERQLALPARLPLLPRCIHPSCTTSDSCLTSAGLPSMIASHQKCSQPQGSAVQPDCLRLGPLRFRGLGSQVASRCRDGESERAPGQRSVDMAGMMRRVRRRLSALAAVTAGETESRRPVWEQGGFTCPEKG